MQREKAKQMLVDNGYRRGGRAKPRAIVVPAQAIEQAAPVIAPPPEAMAAMPMEAGIGRKRGGRC